MLIPTAIFGFALGVLRTVASNIVLPAADLTMLLVMGAAACLGMLITIATIFISKNEGHWDLIFRTLFAVHRPRSDFPAVPRFTELASRVPRAHRGIHVF